MQNSTVDQNEIEKFSRIADEWWDPHGKFKPLHLINPIRLDFIRQKIISHFNIDPKNIEAPYKNLDILDIGCGGGLVSIPVARLGANLMGIDASEKNTKVAAINAEKFNAKCNFIHGNLEGFESKPFDVILALEIIEHVADVETFIKSLEKNLKKGGLLLISTINRTIKSFLEAKLAAEYILRWMPIGTHEYSKFLKPSEINRFLVKYNLELAEQKGLTFNPFTWQWNLSDNIDVNYFMVIKK